MLSQEPVWTYALALQLINQLDPLLREIGWVSGLTGGVLFRGESYKDLDIIIYPFEDGGNFPPEQRSRDAVTQLLFGLGFERHEYGSPSSCLNDVEIWQLNGKRVDFFFFQAPVK